MSKSGFKQMPEPGTWRNATPKESDDVSPQQQYRVPPGG